MSTQKVWVVTETTGEYEERETVVVAVAPTAELAEAFVKVQIDKALVAIVKYAYRDWVSFNLLRQDPNLSADNRFHLDFMLKQYAKRKLDVNSFFSFKRDVFSRDQFIFDIQRMELLQPENSTTISATSSAAYAAHVGSN